MRLPASIRALPPLARQLAGLIAVVVIAALAFAAAGCAGHPNANQALAVSLAALGTGLATASAVCVDRSADTCRTAAMAAGASVAGVAMAAGATTYLRLVSDEQQARDRYERVPGPASRPAR